MKRLLNRRNLASVSIWEARSQRCATDTNEHEKAEAPILGIEALRNIGRIVRAIKTRIDGADGHDRDSTATCASVDPGGRADTGPMGGEDPRRAKKEK